MNNSGSKKSSVLNCEIRSNPSKDLCCDSVHFAKLSDNGAGEGPIMEETEKAPKQSLGSRIWERTPLKNLKQLFRQPDRDARGAYITRIKVDNE
jgi:hypothetical protein